MKHLFVMLVCAALLAPMVAQGADILLYYPPEWAAKAKQARTIAEALSQATGQTIQPVVAQSYPEVIAGFSKNQPALVYVGSFLQAVLHARGLSTPMLQAVDGKELYSSVLIAPASAGNDPVAVVKSAGASVAYAKGASSGESGAKAATGGEASVATPNHYASLMAVSTGSAKCAFVKDWWWKGINREPFKGMSQLEYPGVSDKKNPDNVVSANKLVSAKDIARIKTAIAKNAEAFQVKSFKEFDTALLEPTLALMKKGNINPRTYTW
jgi:ABC-type phosphate/phosphonate transport system substrate-binding protein